MNSRHTTFWLCLAAGLFAFIFFFQRHAHKPPAGPQRVLPDLKLSNVTAVQVRPAASGQIEEAIIATRTNNTWQITQPKAYPAQAASIEDLLAALEELTTSIRITEAELRKRPTSDEDFGFGSPQASLIIWEGEQRTIIHVGAKTSPGDQVYLEVVGSEGGAYVVDADLLKHIPRSVNDWRDTTLLGLERVAFDRVAVTNTGPAFATVLQRDTNTHAWRMTWPLRVRADSGRIEDSLRQLQNLRIKQFISDEPKTDLESLGLAPPELELSLSEGTNITVAMQFGKSPTNDAGQVYGRRMGANSVFTVAKESIAAWRVSARETFRDPLLLRLNDPVSAVQVQARESFSLTRQTNGAWRILPENLPADAALADDFLSILGGLQIFDFVKDVVNPPDLPQYGLTSPASKYIVECAPANSSSSASNALSTELDFGFGTNRPGRVFARRTDESSVYAISTNEFSRLPVAGWQLRERRLWQISTNDIAGITIEQKGRKRQLVRNGLYDWGFAPGSQGVLPNVLAVEETVRGLAQVSALVWVARGQENCSRYGFRESDYKITIELKNGEKAAIQFGDFAPSNNTYAMVEFSGQPWVFEFPWVLYRDVQGFLSIPAAP